MALCRIISIHDAYRHRGGHVAGCREPITWPCAPARSHAHENPEQQRTERATHPIVGSASSARACQAALVAVTAAPFFAGRPTGIRPMEERPLQGQDYQASCARRGFILTTGGPH